ncbi:DDE-domain-containing protein, partial [Calocera viscosa TUFC12733]
ISISGELIRVKACEFAHQFGIIPDDFLSLSHGWLDSFKTRHGLKEYRWHGEAGSMPPDRGLATRAMAGLKGDKTRITYAFTANADGTERLPPFIIGHARKPRCFNNKDGAALGFDYHWNSKAWMTGSLFAEYLHDFDQYLAQDDRHILLLVDNASSHHTIERSQYPHIRIEFFEPNMTSHIQPMDQGIIRCWKAHYRRLFCERAAEREREGEMDIYGINQLEIMQLAHTAWLYVSDPTIANCWRHARILATRGPDGAALPEIEEIFSNPSNENDDEGIREACSGLLDAVVELQEVGALAQSSVMDMAELLEDMDEEITEQEWTDTEIVEQVRANLQGLDLVQEEDDQEEDDEPVLQVMSDAAALSTVRSLGRYLAAQTNPQLRDGALWCTKFSRLLRLQQVRHMTQSSITDYMCM